MPRKFHHKFPHQGLPAENHNQHFQNSKMSIGTELQIRGGIEDNSKIIFLISQRKHVVTSH